MGRTLKILSITVIALILLLVAAVFVITQVIDPNEFKPEIEKQARQQANLTLDIQGDLAWQFWPSLGVSLGRTEARIADDEALFAALDDASVSVAVLPLLAGQVEMDGVTLSGLEANLQQTADGANWERIGPQNGEDTAEEPAAEEETGNEETSLDIPLTIPSVAITEGKVHFQDTTSGTDIVVEHFNLNAQEVNLNEPFPVQLSLRYQDQSDIRVDLNLDTVLSTDLDNNHFILDPLTLDAEIAGATTNPVNVHLEQKIDANLDADNVSISNLLLEAVGTKTTGNITVSGLSGDMQFDGQINTAPFDANKVLQRIGEAPIDTADASALSKVGLNAEIGGKPGSLMVTPLTVTLDQSTLSGEAGLASLDSGKIVFDLNLDQITLDGYMPPSSDEPESDGAAPGGGKAGGTANLGTEPLIPVDALKPLLLDGKISIGSVQYETLNASDLRVAITAKNGVLKLSELSGNSLEGSFNANATLDASGKTPRMSASNTVSHMQLQPLIQWALDDDLAKGVFTMEGNYSASGNSEKALMDSAKGNVELGLSDATVRGLNLYNTLIGGVNDMLGRFKGFSALIPGQESGKLPSALSKDTKILDLTTKARLEQQVAYLDSLDADLEKGEISGKGWLNILNQDFDLSIGMKSPQLSQSKYLQGTTWPLRCEGNLNGSPAKWCGPDKSGFGKIAKKAGAKVAKEKLKDRLGIDGEGDSAEEVIKNAAKKKAKEKTDAAKEKAKKKADEEIRKGLKNLFD